MDTPHRAAWPRFLTLLLAALIGVATGCGGDKKLPVHTVKGVVTYNGKPMVGGGSILFLPTEGGAGKEASGIIGSDGSFQLTTYSQNDGAPAGEFKVVIRQTTVQEPEGGSDNGQKPEVGQNNSQGRPDSVDLCQPGADTAQRNDSGGGQIIEN